MQHGQLANSGEMRDRVVNALRSLSDPELSVNIYDLGLIYRLEVDEAEGRVDIDMTLTAPACPVHVEVVWDPPWTRDRMSKAARLELGFF
jgi:metal-sulfur cluster biosynthetic enzyme